MKRQVFTLIYRKAIPPGFLINASFASISLSSNLAYVKKPSDPTYRLLILTSMSAFFWSKSRMCGLTDTFLGKDNNGNDITVQSPQ